MANSPVPSFEEYIAFVAATTKGVADALASVGQRRAIVIALVSDGDEMIYKFSSSHDLDIGEANAARELLERECDRFARLTANAANG